MPAKRPLEARFWEKVTKTDGCWLWTASTDRAGYGTIGERRRVLKAHRVSWEIANGPIPEGGQVLHTCDNPPCVNPTHLFLGGHLDNMRDMFAKGRRRAPAGERNPRANLTWPKVRAIREAAAAGEPLQTIGKRLDVPRRTVGNVVFKRTWTDDPLGDQTPIPVLRKGRPPKRREGAGP